MAFTWVGGGAPANAVPSTLSYSSRHTGTNVNLIFGESGGCCSSTIYPYRWTQGGGWAVIGAEYSAGSNFYGDSFCFDSSADNNMAFGFRTTTNGLMIQYWNGSSWASLATTGLSGTSWDIYDLRINPANSRVTILYTDENDQQYVAEYNTSWSNTTTSLGSEPITQGNLGFKTNGDIIVGCVIYGTNYFQIYKYSTGAWSQLGSNQSVSGGYQKKVNKWICVKGNDVYMIAGLDGNIFAYKFVGSSWVALGTSLVNNIVDLKNIEVDDDGFVYLFKSSDNGEMRIYQWNGSVWNLTFKVAPTGNFGYDNGTLFDNQVLVVCGSYLSGSGYCNAFVDSYYTPLSTFSAPPQSSGNVVTSTVSLPKVVALAGGDTYFDSTSKISRVDVYYTSPSGRQRKRIVHQPITSSTSWSNYAQDGTWTKSKMVAYDYDGAQRNLDRTSLNVLGLEDLNLLP